MTAKRVTTVRKITVKDLQAYAASVYPDDPRRQKRYLRYNTVDEFQLPDYETICLTVARLRGIVNDVTETANEMTTALNAIDEELASRYLNLSNLEDLYNVNGWLRDLFSSYESLLYAVKPPARGFRELAAVARKIGAGWFVKFTQRQARC